MSRVFVLGLLLSFSSLILVSCNGDSTQPASTNSWTLAFDGSDDYVRVGDNAALDLSGSFTLSAWFYHSGGAGCVPGIIQKDGPGSWGRYGIWLNGNKADFCLYPEGETTNTCLLSTTDLQMNAWNHIAAVYDGAEMRIYLNGVLDSQKAQTGAVSTSDAPLYIGADPTEPGYLPGRISEVRVWNKARSQSEIQGDMNKRLAGTEAGLVLYLRMDDGSGQTLTDASASGLTATRGGSTQSEPGDPRWVGVDWPY